MPSFDYQKKKLLFKRLKLSVLDLFLTEFNFFVVTKRIMYRKKVPLGTGTEFKVPIPVPYWFKCELYPTLVNNDR